MKKGDRLSVLFYAEESNRGEALRFFPPEGDTTAQDARFLCNVHKSGGGKFVYYADCTNAKNVIQWIAMKPVRYIVYHFL